MITLVEVLVAAAVAVGVVVAVVGLVVAAFGMVAVALGLRIERCEDCRHLYFASASGPAHDCALPHASLLHGFGLRHH